MTRYEVDRADLIAFAWSAPMRDLAAKIGMSDVGLRKLLAGQGVSLPPQGHWNRVHAGRAVPKAPSTEPRRLGQWPNAQVDARFRGLIVEAPDPPADGPFASRHVPEDLADLYAQEYDAIGRVSVITNLSRIEPSLASLIRKEEVRREKARERTYFLTGPRYDAPFDQRRLRVLNTILLAVAKRGGSGWVHEREDDFEMGISIADSGVQIVIDESSRLTPSRRYARPVENRPASTVMVIAIANGALVPCETQWRDDANGKVETKLRDVVASIMTVAEANLRRAVKQRHIARVEEQLRRQKIEELARFEAQKRRLEALRACAEKLREADEIRALVSRVQGSLVELDEIDVAPDLAGWARWALQYADEIDPIVNRAILKTME